MKVSLNWIKEYTDVKLSVDELVEKIGAQLGAVEEVINLGERYQGIVVVKVVECVKHPNADKLSICKIDDGRKVKGVKRDPNGYVQVVCGAPNVKKGMMAAWLPPGTIVPSTFEGEQLKLESREIRGEVSNGMLASANELALGDDHSGIVELYEPFCKPGDDFAEAFQLDDYIIDIENKMFTHRPDLFGILGVAREIAGITHRPFDFGARLKEPIKLAKEGPSLAFKVDNKLPKLVPRFTAVAIRIEQNGQSPVWMKSYLIRAGLRPINAVVDVTNYYMHLTGQPLHAYDADKLPTASLETRLSKKGEKLKLLNGKEVMFVDDQTILITSGGKPVGIGGVMGGADTEVDETTKSVILECANFDMYAIRKTAMQYGLFTDAVTRFNKGQSSLQQDRYLALAAKSVCLLGNGKVASDIIDKHGTLEQPKPVRVTPEFINERLGLNLSAKKMTELLENVEFRVMTAAGKQLAVTPPFWRTDISIPEDIVEEIGRLYGYDHLPLELPKRDLTPAAEDPLLAFKSRLREVLSKSGANEVLTYSFVHGDLMQKAGQDPKHAYQLSNAISPDLQYYRLSLLPSLLDLVHPNIKAGHDEFALFEIGKAHVKGLMDEKEPDVPAEEERLAMVFAADDKATKGVYGGAPYYQALTYLDELLQQLNITYTVEPTENQPMHEAGRQALAPFAANRSACVYVGDELAGFVGEFKPGVRQALKLPVFSAGFELNITDLLAQYKATSNYRPLPRFPKVEQDITLRLPAKTAYSEVFTLLWEKLDELKPYNTLANLSPLDVYQKDETHKNITWRLTIASYERTLTDSEINKLLDEIAVAAEQLGAQRI